MSGLSRSVTAVAAAVLLVTVCGRASANLVANGGFETGDFTGWSLGGDTTDVAVDAYPNSGAFSASLGNERTGTLGQSIATVPGKTYVVRWYLRNADFSFANTFSASFAGKTVADLADVPAQPSYAGYEYFVQAASTSSQLTFTSTNQWAWDLDDVSVTVAPVPLPAAALLFSTGLAGLAAVGRATRRRSPRG